MKRKEISKPRCSGLWTEAQFVSFIKSQLRGATRKWKPISDCLKEARVSKGVYKCNGCKCNVPVTVVVNNKRIKNVFVDHIKPVVDPKKGFLSWDSFINLLFCERENLQLLCGQCHDEKTLAERQSATERRKRIKIGQ